MSASPPEPPTWAIIGGGASGTLTAANLLWRADRPLAVALIERTSAFGRGVAYTTTNPVHLLNVPVGRMSAYPDDPDHFLRWLRQNGPTELADADLGRAFVPRFLYFQYLNAVLDEAEAHARPGVELERIGDEAVALRRDADGFAISLRGGRTLRASQVVLTSGYLPPRDPPVADRSFYASPRYVRDAWSPDAFARLAPDDAVLLIGTGLTMVDVAVGLAAAGHPGRIVAISRRGLAPLAHAPAAAHPTALPADTTTATARGLTHRLRAEARAAAAEGRDWRGVVDAQRSVTAALWQNLPDAEQRRALRHLVPYWDVHRHRIAPAVAETLDRLIEKGQLVIRAGRIRAFREDPGGVTVSFVPRGQSDEETIRVGLVVNCTGASVDCRGEVSPLLASMIKEGVIQPDPRGLGLASEADGALRGADGRRTPGLWTVGIFRKGLLWESTAIPEIRDQAATLAATLLPGDDPSGTTTT